MDLEAHDLGQGTEAKRKQDTAQAAADVAGHFTQRDAALIITDPGQFFIPQHMVFEPERHPDLAAVEMAAAKPGRLSGRQVEQAVRVLHQNQRVLRRDTGLAGFMAGTGRVERTLAAVIQADNLP